VKVRKRIIVYIAILIVLLAALLVLFLYDRNNRNVQSNELDSAAQSFLDKLKNGAGDSEYEQEINDASLGTNADGDLTNAFPDNAAMQAPILDSSSKVAKINGQTILGIITISKIGVKYPIIQYVNQKSLNISICKYSQDKKLNDLGNVALIGHNMSNGLMFHNLDKLKDGDIIQITDASGQTITYGITSSYIIEPQDTDCLKTADPEKRELTLITCVTGDFSRRFIIKAEEIY